MAPRNPQDPGDRRSPWTRPGFLTAAALLGALVILAIILVATSGGGTTHTTQTQASNPTSTSTTTSSAARTTVPVANPGGCSLAPGNQQVPNGAPPQGTTWSQAGSMSVPQAPHSLGPQHATGQWNRCFAHSPSGALLDVINFIGSASSGDPGQVLHHLAVGVPGTLPACDQGGSIDSAAGGPVQLAGYRFNSYAPTDANIVLALKAPKGMLAVALTAVWTQSDWHIQYPPGGCASGSQISSLDGYVPWSAF